MSAAVAAVGYCDSSSIYSGPFCRYLPPVLFIIASRHVSVLHSAARLIWFLAVTSQAAALPSGSARAEALLALVGPASSAKDVGTLKAVLDAVVNDAVPAASAKPVLTAVCEAATSWGSDYENIVAVADHAVTRLQYVVHDTRAVNVPKLAPSLCFPRASIRTMPHPFPAPPVAHAGLAWVPLRRQTTPSASCSIACTLAQATICEPA